jgi:hypothetical protein
MYTVYAWKPAEDTPLMRKQVHRLCVEISQDSRRNVDISGELTATVPPGLRWSYRRQGRNSEPIESPTLRVYQKLRQSLGEFVGVACFYSLASRALALAKPEAPSLNAAQVSGDGALLGLSEIETQIGMNKDPAGEGGIILIDCLLGLLRIFVGEALTLSLLRNAWPGEAFDDRNWVHGRKA